MNTTPRSNDLAAISDEGEFGVDHAMGDMLAGTVLLRPLPTAAARAFHKAVWPAFEAWRAAGKALARATRAARAACVAPEQERLPYEEAADAARAFYSETYVTLTEVVRTARASYRDAKWAGQGRRKRGPGSGPRGNLKRRST